MLPMERFTVGAQDLARRAYEINQRYGHNQVDTEHILLANLEQPRDEVPQILEKIGVDQELITKRLDDVLSASPKAETPMAAAGQVFISPRVAHILNLADEEATRLKDEHISSGHIFLAILSEHDTPVAGILTEAGLTEARVASLRKDSSK